MIDSTFLEELRKFNLIINKRVISKYSGEQKSHYSGSGTLFKDHRQYSLGDNYRAIDWKVYGRTDDLYIKLFEEERNLNVHVLIDSSASMQYNNKFDFAAKLALGFGFLATKNNERVQYATFSDDIQILKGLKGNRQILNLLEHVNKIKPSGKTNLYTSIQQYKKYIKNKSFIVIISDFFTDPKEIIDSLFLLGKDHTIKIIQVLDKDEKMMPLEGDFKLIDSETNFILKTYISKRTQLKYLENLKTHYRKIKEGCESFPKVDFYQFSTNEKIFDVFFNLVN